MPRSAHWTTPMQCLRDGLWRLAMYGSWKPGLADRWVSETKKKWWNMEDLRWSNQKIYEDFPGIGIWYNKQWIFGVCPYTWGIYPQQIVFLGKNWGFKHLYFWGGLFSDKTKCISDMMTSSSNQGYKRDTIGTYSVYWYKLVKDVGWFLASKMGFTNIYNGIEFVLAYDGYINSKLPDGLHARQCCWYCINAGDFCF